MKVIVSTGISIAAFLICILLTFGIYDITASYQMLVYGRYASLILATVAGILYFTLKSSNKQSKVIFFVIYSVVCPYALMFVGLFLSCMLGDCI
jgi:hypothetical protein